MNTHEQYITTFVQGAGFALGKDLNISLQEKFSISSDNARKVIQRAVINGIIDSDSRVTFGNGQFVYLPKGKFLNKEMILKITKIHRPTLYRIISLMDLNDGIISFHEAFKVAGAALDAEKTKTDTLGKLIAELELLRMVEIITDARGVKYLLRPSAVERADAYTAQHYARMKTDAMFIPDILRSLRGFNIIDNNSMQYRNKATPSEGVRHNNFVWDSIAYTKTTGINPRKSSTTNISDKQTLVAMDIVINRTYTDHDLQGFYSRVQSVLNSVKTGIRKVLPIVVYAKIDTQEVYNTTRKLGFLTLDLGEIYGSNIHQVIENLNALRIDESSLSNDSNDISKIIKTLSTVKDSGQEDNLKNIKGDLFEFLMYPLIKNIFPDSTIEHSKILKDPKNNKEHYEYDFIIHNSNLNEYTVIELKGYNSTAKFQLGSSEEKSTVKWFYGKTFPFAKKILSTQYNNPKVTGCFITSAGFQDEAVVFMDGLNKGKIKPANIDTWYDGKKLMELLDSKGLKKIKSTIVKYYVK